MTDTTTIGHELSPSEIARYHADGFLIRPRFIDAATVAQLRVAYDEIITQQVPARGDRMLGGLTRQVMFPAATHPRFDRNPAVAAGIAVARQLLGRSDIARSFDMLIDKPPGHPHPTPWHQDMAYSRAPFAPAGTPIVLDTVQFWVALDDADAENGCMHFAAGHHTRALLSHHVAAGDPTDDGRLLAIDDPERDLDLEAVHCAAIPAGGVTVHSYGTPHFTPPNRSCGRPRRAYIFNIATTNAARRIGEDRDH